jgi:hypothetical protein
LSLEGLAAASPSAPLQPVIHAHQRGEQIFDALAEANRSSFAARVTMRSRSIRRSASSRPVPQTMWKRGTELPGV